VDVAIVSLFSLFTLLGGTTLGWWLGRLAAHEERLAERRLQREQEKRAAYSRLMRAGRELRYIARRLMKADRYYQKPLVDPEEEIRTQVDFYTARYEVNIFAPPESVRQVDTYRKAVSAFYREARDTPGSDQLPELRRAAGVAQDILEQQFRAEFEIVEPPSTVKHFFVRSSAAGLPTER
jgi:hypothetical protein